MESFKLALVIISLLCISSLLAQHEPLARKNGIVRHKKKMVASVKKPLRPQQQHPHQQERPARRSNYGPRDPSHEEFVATSEHPSVSWKPITYAVYSHSPLSTSEPTESTVVAVSEKTDKPQPRQHEDQVTDQNQEYTLYQYYIPFEQLITQSKPIIEHSGEPSKESLNLDKINKAGVEPVTVFKKENEGEASSSHSENDNEFTGRYEYEYFVQDDHWGTNFGHKEYRDEKYTKGDYEVVLPDGRVQHVKYWSDATGYHASVTYHPLYQKYKQIK